VVTVKENFKKKRDLLQKVFSIYKIRRCLLILSGWRWRSGCCREVVEYLLMDVVVVEEACIRTGDDVQRLLIHWKDDLLLLLKMRGLGQR